MLGFVKRSLRRMPGADRLYRSLIFRHTPHYYSPLTDIRVLRGRESRLYERRADLGPGLDLNTPGQLALLDALLPYCREFDAPEAPAAGRRYYARQDFFGRDNAMFLAALLRHCRPRRVIEVGSGFSSAVMLDTADGHLGKETRFTFIDPYPQRLLSLLSETDRGRCEVVRDEVQNVPTARFAELAENDILFVDSSHVSKTGSDLNHILFEILPVLARGVYVHFHDVHWPFEYPRHWVYEGRCWNEAYLLRAFLQFNRAYEIALFDSYLLEEFRPRFERDLPHVAGGSGGSLWLRRVA